MLLGFALNGIVVWQAAVALENREEIQSGGDAASRARSRCLSRDEKQRLRAAGYGGRLGLGLRLGGREEEGG